MKPIPSLSKANSSLKSLASQAPSGGTAGKMARKPQGFALVVTLSLMILLTVIAVGLLTLSTISLRSSSQGSAQAEARANAKLALMLAIGELQKQMGPDQRISANGAILTDSAVANPHWAGVWNSWHAGTPDPAAPPSPDGTSAHQTIGTAATGMSPTYAAQRADHFRAWLVSLTPTQTAAIKSAENFQPTATKSPAKADEAVELVGEGSIGANRAADHVKAGLISFKANANSTSPVKGRYGWWIGDESQKARVMEDSYNSDPPDNDAERIFRAQAPGSTGTSVVKGLENITDDKQLKALPTLQTLNLLDGATKKPAATPAENFHTITPYSRQVLADVREGGLKRDLSTLLERPIDLADPEFVTKPDKFMLYKFTTKESWMGNSSPNQEAVPIQDLAAYYQLYDSSRTGWREGVRFDSTTAPGTIQTSSPDFGDGSPAGKEKYLREYTALYRQPVPIKVQFLLSMFRNPIVPAPAANSGADTDELVLGITPSVTLWNPTNVPLVMRFDASNPNRFAQLFRMLELPLRLRWMKYQNGSSNPAYSSDRRNLFWYTSGQVDFNPHLFNLYFSGKTPVRFEPGEVKVFSLPYSKNVEGVKSSLNFTASGAAGQQAYKGDFLFKTDKYFEGHEAVNIWEPDSFMFYRRSAVGGITGHIKNNRMTFKSGDKISFEVTADNPHQSTSLDSNAGRSNYGNWLGFFMSQANHHCAAADNGSGKWGWKTYQASSRSTSVSSPEHFDFNQKIMTQGFPGNSTLIKPNEQIGHSEIPDVSNVTGRAFLHASFMAGTESLGGGNVITGRRFASRPFLHSSAIRPSQIDANDVNSLYNYGWNWWVQSITSVFGAPVETSGGRGFYGGGYSQLQGSTHVVQQEIPLTPPISLAAFSHAHLGGFSIVPLVDTAEVGGAYAGKGSPGAQRVTATGQAGLFPATLQAIGNSYAHPNIPADAAFTTIQKTFMTNEGANPVIMADHSYLANKAIWDEYFLSSITPKVANNPIFGNGPAKAAKEVADEFFFANGNLPNRRIAPHKVGFSQRDLDTLFTTKDKYEGGLADRIAAHLMVEGAFNVNSTSEEAWKTVLSSMKDKPVTYFNKGKTGTSLDTAEPNGTSVSSFNVPNSKPTAGSSSDKSEQWLGSRVIGDTEIAELATAMVKQVKTRGPFLSLSEFVNRRLEGSATESAKLNSVKGALQAAIDDTNVSINSDFRNATRRFTSNEETSTTWKFPEAIKGPIAYGSAAYVDQADILRQLGTQLTPRGDTFVVRTYGDSLNAQGTVQARVWCEAVLQRVPEYIDSTDQPHIKQAELTSLSNKTFGRKFQIVSFRWLNSSEI